MSCQVDVQGELFLKMLKCQASHFPFGRPAGKSPVGGRRPIFQRQVTRPASLDRLRSRMGFGVWRAHADGLPAHPSRLTKRPKLVCGEHDLDSRDNDCRDLISRAPLFEISNRIYFVIVHISSQDDDAHEQDCRPKAQPQERDRADD